MPAIGDQHRLGPGDNPAISANPYLKGTGRVEEFTPTEVASLRERLNKQLGPEFLSSRPSGGGKVHYITADKCINLANEVFGFNGWSSSIQNITQDFADENPTTGYGHIENCKGKAAAFEKAKKEGTTDALKRTLRTFGNVLGNCIYDKEYLSKVVKIKATPVKFDVDNLHRHVDFVPPKVPTAAPTNRIIKQEYQNNGPSNLPARVPDIENITAEDSLAYEFEGEFGKESDYSRRSTGQNGPSATHPPTDARNFANATKAATTVDTRKPIASVSANGTVPSHNGQADGINRSNMTGPKTPVPGRFAQDQNNDSRHPSGRQAMQPNGPPFPHSNDQGRPKHDPAPNNDGNKASGAQSSEDKASEDHVVGFFSARAAEALINDPHTAVKSAPVFDPQFDSPSIRKTAGIDHTSSSPIVRKSLQALQQQAGKVPLPGAKANAPTPNSGHGPIGRPPMTSSYRPPIRRSMGAVNSGNASTASNMPPPVRNHNSPINGGQQQNEYGKRLPLVDTTNVPNNERTKNQADAAKRTRVEDANAPKQNLQGQQ
ncbi:RAD52 DNA repair protein RADC [Trichophyton benhamiae CBS 112371]|uniref:RAD52 DNA repair protein RADC n=1 Tax=Arthroderma benhamiae (strain ATCC MYA-4681 / CBS 112371) TaxID=663331 RepID=D4AZJ0_ARTBC|nr:RAD52 DNA repair protein RADC [Trichophyton benhamiae CBS 112371]EFE31460.1 RAD52 DNA repair protein RADC [Trichophyton benhamiae CBS 112371]